MIRSIERRDGNPTRTTRNARIRARGVAGVVALVLTASVGVNAQSAATPTLHDVLSFLLTNRSIPTDDFRRDEQAATATSDAMSAFLLVELSSLPISTSAGGFTYRLDPTIGASLRASDSFGPFFTERALTAGARQITVGVTYQQSIFRNIDGHALGNGTLVSTASKFHDETQFFDVETLSLSLRTDTATLLTNVGLTDRVDVGAALPLVRVTLGGQRLDTYRGRQSTQSVASGTTNGPGDLILRGKYNALLRTASGIAVGGELRLPTGDEENLRGTGHASVTPRLIASLERDRASFHGNAGYAFGGLSNELNASMAVTVAASQRLTLVGELTGRRLSSLGRLTETVARHPTLVDVDTVRLTSTTESTSRLLAVAGFKWNLASTWLLSANALLPLTSSGLNPTWTPTITIDHSFTR